MWRIGLQFGDGKKEGREVLELAVFLCLLRCHVHFATPAWQHLAVYILATDESELRHLRLPNAIKSDCRWARLTWPAAAEQKV